MAFLDNSGDIILDAVLTDTGRFRLAKGDGSFKIAKFALGDDEINYGNFNKNHTSGSAYFDLDILQTPILEAFTNNASSMQSKLISISRTDLLYLPVMKIDNILSVNSTYDTSGLFLFTVDSATNTAIFGSNGDVTGIYKAFDYAGQSTKFIQIDQGLDTAAISFLQPLDADLVENQYIIEIDSRLGSIVDKTGNNSAVASFIDDDYIASYYLSTNDTNFANVIPASATANARSSNILAGQIGRAHV